jgi:hypothetical protein
MDVNYYGRPIDNPSLHPSHLISGLLAYYASFAASGVWSRAEVIQVGWQGTVALISYGKARRSRSLPFAAIAMVPTDGRLLSFIGGTIIETTTYVWIMYKFVSLPSLNALGREHRRHSYSFHDLGAHNAVDGYLC